MSKRKSAQATTDLPTLARPAQRALQNASIHDLEQLTRVSEAEIARLHGIGPSALKQLRRALEERGLSFRRDKPGPDSRLDQAIRTHLDNIRSQDRQAQNQACSDDHPDA